MLRRADSTQSCAWQSMWLVSCENRVEWGNDGKWMLHHENSIPFLSCALCTCVASVAPRELLNCLCSETHQIKKQKVKSLQAKTSTGPCRLKKTWGVDGCSGFKAALSHRAGACENKVASSSVSSSRITYTIYIYIKSPFRQQTRQATWFLPPPPVRAKILQ